MQTDLQKRACKSINLHTCYLIIRNKPFAISANKVTTCDPIHRVATFDYNIISHNYTLIHFNRCIFKNSELFQENWLTLYYRENKNKNQ